MSNWVVGVEVKYGQTRKRITILHDVEADDGEGAKNAAIEKCKTMGLAVKVGREEVSATDFKVFSVSKNPEPVSEEKTAEEITDELKAGIDNG